MDIALQTVLDDVADIANVLWVASSLKLWGGRVGGVGA